MARDVAAATQSCLSISAQHVAIIPPWIKIPSIAKNAVSVGKMMQRFLHDLWTLKMRKIRDLEDRSDIVLSPT